MNQTARERRAFTLIECAIVGCLSLLVCGMAQAFSVSATNASNHAVASEDASRAILLASEMIQQDLRRSIVATPTDLVIAPGGHEASFTLATGRFQNWNANFETVSYKLEKLPGGDKRLVRTDSTGRHCPNSIVLRDLIFQEMPQCDETPWRTTVLVTLVAPLNAHDIRTVSIEIPISRGKAPPPYPWKGPPGGTP